MNPLNVNLLLSLIAVITSTMVGTGGARFAASLLTTGGIPARAAVSSGQVMDFLRSLESGRQTEWIGNGGQVLRVGGWTRGCGREWV